MKSLYRMPFSAPSTTADVAREFPKPPSNIIICCKDSWNSPETVVLKLARGAMHRTECGEVPEEKLLLSFPHGANTPASWNCHHQLHRLPPAAQLTQAPTG